MLESLAHECLPKAAGERFCNVVLKCLRCVEDPAFGAVVRRDALGICIGNRTTEKTSKVEFGQLFDDV